MPSPTGRDKGISTVREGRQKETAAITSRNVAAKFTDKNERGLPQRNRSCCGIAHIENKGWPPRGRSWGGYACAATVAGGGEGKNAPPPGGPAGPKRPPSDPMIGRRVGGPPPDPLS